MQYYGIDTILTFDEDFRRVPWLKVVPQGVVHMPLGRIVMSVYGFNIEPVAPFQFTPHLERFTLAGLPTPFIWLGEKRLLRLAPRAGNGFVAVDALFRGEPWRPIVELKDHADAVSRAVEARDVSAETIRASFNYNHFLEAVKDMDKRLYKLASRHPGLRPGKCMASTPPS